MVLGLDTQIRKYRFRLRSDVTRSSNSSSGQHAIRLSGLNALVTGGHRGIGRRISLALAAAGAKVAVTSRTMSPLTDSQTAPAWSLATELDVRKLTSIAACFATISRTWGRLDILVNNAGINIPKGLFETTEDDWDEILDTDLKGLFFVTQSAARMMLDAGRGGRIVNIASTLGIVGQQRRCAYSAAKGGVVNLTRSLALELAPHNITVNAVAPTLVMTEMTERFPADELEAIKKRIPIGRVATGDDVAAAVLYLASPGAAMITGQTLVVDGGLTAS